MKRCVCGLLAVVLISGVAQAGQWYVGVDVGSIDYEFTPTYSFVSGRPDTEFKNEASGTEIGLNGGYMQEISDLLSVGFQAHVSANDAEWTLTLPDPADFSYEQPYTWGLSLVPVIKLWKGTSLVLEAGLVQGSVKQKKYGSPESNYDVEETIGGTLLGAGLSYALKDNMDVIIKYQRTDFFDFAYKTTSPDGALVETVWDDPIAESWRLGMVVRF